MLAPPRTTAPATASGTISIQGVHQQQGHLRAVSTLRSPQTAQTSTRHAASACAAVCYNMSCEASRDEQWWTRDVLEWRIQMLVQGQVPAGVPASETRELMALLNLMSDAGELKSVAARRNEAAQPTPPEAQPEAAPAAARCRSASAASAAPSPAASRCRSASAAAAAPAAAPAPYVPAGAQLPMNARKATRIGGFLQMFDPLARSSTVDGADFFMPSEQRSGRRNSLRGSGSGRRNSLRLSMQDLLGISEGGSNERSPAGERQSEKRPTSWHVVNGHRVPARRRAPGDPAPPASPPPVRIDGEPPWCLKPRPPV